MHLRPEEQQDADYGAVVETHIFAWHDKSFLLVLCFAGKEAAALCAGVGLKEEAFKTQRNGTFRHFDPPNVHKDVLFLATEVNSTEGLNS